jgi:hypothetical protein
MSEDAKEDKKDAKAAAPAAPKGGGIKALIGPIAAGAVLVGIGVFIGNTLAGFTKPAVTPEEAAKADKAKAEAHATDHDEGGSVLSHTVELDMGEIKSNVSGQNGKRYVVMNVVLRIPHELHTIISAIGGGGGGGGHGGGGGEAAGGKEVLRILQAAFEDHIKTYTLDELGSANVSKRLERGFAEKTEQELRELLKDQIKKEEKLKGVRLVQRVVITGLLMQ